MLQGKELSYTNLLDLDAALRIVLEFSEPAAAVIKHTNPCGAATGSRRRRAYVRAREADRAVRLRRHRRPQPPDRRRRPRGRSSSTFIEAVIAPAVDDDARCDAGGQAQHARRDRRLRAAGARLTTRELRSILGAVLVQARDRVDRGRRAMADATSLRVVTKRQPTAEEWQALRFAWRICAHVKSNTVIFTDRRSDAGDRRRADEPRGRRATWRG